MDTERICVAKFEIDRKTGKIVDPKAGKMPAGAGETPTLPETAGRPTTELFCYDEHGRVAAVVKEQEGVFVVQGRMDLWKATAFALLPFVREAAAGYDPTGSDFAAPEGGQSGEPEGEA